MRLGPVVLAAIAVLAILDVSRGALAADSASADDLVRARVLDQQGVRAFREGHYNDAIRYFTEALKLGGPSSELWNIARCHVKLDESEAASEALERYLSRNDLSPDDRAQARRELEEIARRPSTVTIASSPTGAFVAVDGKRIGRTPISADVPAGEHVIAVQREGSPPHLEHIVARYGRAIIVDARFGGAGDSGGEGGVASTRSNWFTASLEAAGLFSKLGSVGGPIHAGALVSAAYVAYERHGVDIEAGARLTITDDSWDNTVHAPALACGLGGSETRAALGVFADGAVGYRPLPRLRIGGDAGFGFASEPSSALGGDVFVPSCQASPGIVPAGHFGADVSYSVLPTLRLVASPIVFEVLSAFGGARSVPIDATGAWIRVGAGLGVAVDL
jgi:PEGA domain